MYKIDSNRFILYTAYILYTAVLGGIWSHKTDKHIYNYTRSIKLSFGGLACRPTGAVKYTFTIIHNINKLKQGNARISKANKIKDIMLINSYVTHHNRYIQYKQNLTTCKAHIYRPHKNTLHSTTYLIFIFSLIRFQLPPVTVLYLMP